MFIVERLFVSVSGDQVIVVFVFIVERLFIAVGDQVSVESL